MAARTHDWHTVVLLYMSFQTVLVRNLFTVDGKTVTHCESAAACASVSCCMVIPVNFFLGSSYYFPLSLNWMLILTSTSGFLLLGLVEGFEKKLVTS